MLGKQDREKLGRVLLPERQTLLLLGCTGRALQLGFHKRQQLHAHCLRQQAPQSLSYNWGLQKGLGPKELDYTLDSLIMLGLRIETACTAKIGGCLDQCVWSSQLHYMTVTCLGIQKICRHNIIYMSTSYSSVVEWGCVNDFLCEVRYYHREYHCHMRYRDIIPYGDPIPLGRLYLQKIAISHVETEVTTP